MVEDKSRQVCSVTTYRAATTGRFYKLDLSGKSTAFLSFITLKIFILARR